MGRASFAAVVGGLVAAAGALFLAVRSIDLGTFSETSSGGLGGNVSLQFPTLAWNLGLFVGACLLMLAALVLLFVAGSVQRKVNASEVAAAARRRSDPLAYLALGAVLLYGSLGWAVGSVSASAVSGSSAAHLVISPLELGLASMWAGLGAAAAYRAGRGPRALRMKAHRVRLVAPPA